MPEKVIIQLEEDLRSAMLTSNTTKLDELIADTLIFTIPDGSVMGKEDDIKFHKTGIQKLYKLDHYDQTTTILNDIAIVTTKTLIEGTINNNDISGKYCYTRIWKIINNKWQIIAGHCSIIQ
ncbi:MAG: nuclear transport factor 2 family protein [Vampirovibrionia bacterium]